MRRYGLVDIPDQASDIDAVPITRTITINGTTFDLSADRTYTVGGMAIGGTVTSGTTGSVLFIGASSALAQDNANFFWDDTNNRLGIGTNSPSSTLTIGGNTTILATGSTTTTPRTLSVSFGTSTEAARWQFGDALNSIQNSFGGRFILQSYWGMSIYGGRISATALGFELGLTTDWSLNVIGTTAANPVFVVTGASSQTGNLQQWRNSSSTVLSAVTSDGSLLLGKSTAAGYRLDVVGTAISTSTSTSSTTSTYGVIGSTNLTYSSGASLTGGIVENALQGGLNHTMGGNLTVPNSCVLSANIGVSGLRFTSGGTVTSTQASGSSRAISNFAALPIKNDLTVAGTISHFANFHGYSPYSTTATNLTFTNFYHILLNDSLQYTGIAITNKWGIYQEGATDNNYFNGKVLIKTTTDAGYELDVNGTSRANKFQLSALNTAPATSSSTGTLGEIRIDANHIYICTATNTWKRVAIATF